MLLGLLLWPVTGDRCLTPPVVDRPPPPPDALLADLAVPDGECEYLRCMPDGDSGVDGATEPPSDLKLTLMGRTRDEDAARTGGAFEPVSALLCGILSGGPIGLSSRLRLRFLSVLLVAFVLLVLVLLQRSSVRRWCG